MNRPDSPDPPLLARLRGEAYTHFARLLARPPDEELVNRFLSRNPGLRSGADPDEEAGQRLMARYREQALACPGAQVLEELAVDRTRIVRGYGTRSGGGQGLRPPYEGLYRTDLDPHQALLGVKEFYRSSGFVPEEAVREPADFLGLELDFMARLCAEEAQSAGAEAARAGRFQRRFMEEHLGLWAGEYCARAGDAARTGFFQGSLRLLAALIRHEREFLRTR